MEEEKNIFIARSSSEIFEKEKKYNFNTISRNFLDSKKGRIDTVVLEGVQTFKHALRFEAEFIFVFIKNKNEVIKSLKSVIPDEIDILEEISLEISSDEFEKLSSHSITSDILSLAVKKKENFEEFIKNDHKNQNKKPIIFLEDAADLGNIGSSIRAAAAFGTAALIVSGKSSPWHQRTIKSATGLNFAIPIFEVKDFKELYEKFSNRVFVTADDKGENIKKTKISKNSIIVFGTERAGVKKTTKDKCSKIISLPMQKKVSSLNLATSVSAFLYGADFE